MEGTEPAKGPQQTTQTTTTQTVDETTRQAAPHQHHHYQQPPTVIYQPMQYVTAQPINNGYTIQGIVVPRDDRQIMFNDDVLIDVVPQQKTKVVIMKPQESTPTVCTSPMPQLFYCTVDKKTLVSEVRYKTNYGMLCCWICLFVWLFPFSIIFLCCFPCMGYKEVIHTCPDCRRNVGRAPCLM